MGSCCPLLRESNVLTGPEGGEALLSRHRGGAGVSKGRDGRALFSTPGTGGSEGEMGPVLQDKLNTRTGVSPASSRELSEATKELKRGQQRDLPSLGLTIQDQRETPNGTCPPARCCKRRKDAAAPYLKVVCLLVVEVVVVVREGGPPDQGGDLWTGKEFERGPQKGAFDSHLHPQGHGQQLLAFPALLGLPNHSALLLIVQPQSPGEHSAQCPALPGAPRRAWEAQAVRGVEGRPVSGSRLEAAVASGLQRPPACDQEEPV